MKPALKTKDDAQVQLKTSVSTSAKTMLLETGQGSELPDPIDGAATSDGSSTQLNCTGAGSLGAAFLDEIWNVTKDKHALVISTSTDQIVTTPLTDNSGNTAAWEEDDIFCINPFPLTLVRYDTDGTTEIQKEVVRAYKRASDTIYIDDNGRAQEGTTALEWIPGDYAEMRSMSLFFETLKEKINYLRSLLEGDATIPGLKTFGQLPRCSETPSTGTELITKAFFDANTTAGGFSLSGTRSSAIMPRALNWSDVIDSGNYKVYRNIDAGGWELQATLGHTVGEYTDSEIVSGTVQYKVEALDDNGIFQASNVIEFQSTVDNAVVVSEFGDQSDGAYVSGNLDKGRIYQFSSFDLSSSMNISGNGLALIFVDGNMTVGAGGIINAISGQDGDYYPSSVSVHGNAKSTVTGGGAGGTGGTGQAGSGSGGSGGTPGTGGTAGNDGNDGTDGYYSGQLKGYGGTGGAGGSTGATAGGGGGGGGGAAGNYGVPPTYDGGTGGVGGDSPALQQSVIFVVSGNIDFQAGSQIVGQGLDGGDGGDGEDVAFPGGDGGGGGGAGGADGCKFHFLHGGTYNAPPTQTLDEGAGGAGGSGHSGNNGSNGSDGTAGSVTNTQL